MSQTTNKTTAGETGVMQDRTNIPTPTNSGEQNGGGGKKQHHSRKHQYSKERAHKALSSVDKDFQGKEPTLGVLGVPSEGHLTHGSHLEDFLEALVIYSETKFDDGSDLKPLLEHLESPLLQLEKLKPVAPQACEMKDKDGNVVLDENKVIKMYFDPAEKLLYEIELKDWVARKRKEQSNEKKLYSVVNGQCTPTLLQDIKGKPDYDEKHKQSDVLWLIKTIKGIKAGIVDKGNKMMIYTEQLKKLGHLFQGPTETLDEFMKRVLSESMILKEIGGKAVFLPDLTTYYVDEKAKEEAFLAMIFFMGADRYRFGGKVRKLIEDNEEGDDKFPTTLREAYEMLVKVQTRWMEDMKKGGHGRRNGMNFMLAGPGENDEDNSKLVPGTGGIARRGVQCYKCQGHGHFQRECPKKDKA